MGAAEWSVISIWKDTPNVIYKAGSEEKNAATTTKAKKNIHHIFVSSGSVEEKTLVGWPFFSFNTLHIKGAESVYWNFHTRRIGALSLFRQQADFG